MRRWLLGFIGALLLGCGARTPAPVPVEVAAEVDDQDEAGEEAPRGGRAQMDDPKTTAAAFSPDGKFVLTGDKS